MKGIFEYLDYRQYLRDWFEAKKRSNSHYSLRTLSNKAGFRAADFPHRVMHGDRNLSGESLFKLASALGLDEAETEYFERLVKFNQSESPDERDFHARKVVALRSARIAPAKLPRLEADQYEFYSQWWHPVIRCLLGLFDFREDWKRLGSMLNPPISAAKARRSVELLERLGMVRRGPDGSWRPVESVLVTGTPIVPMALKSFHAATTRLSDRAREKVPQDQQSLHSVTLGIHRKAMPQVRDMVRDFSTEILNKLASGEIGSGLPQDGDMMAFHLQFHLFPVSNRVEDPTVSDP